MRRIDNTESDKWLKVAITGGTGTGKTWFGASGPKPLILLSEYQGKASIDSYLATYPKRNKPAVLWMEHAQNYWDVLRALGQPKDKPLEIKATIFENDQPVGEETVMTLDEWPETIVLDSLTDALDLVRQKLWKTAKVPVNQYNLPDETFSHRRELLDRGAKFIRAFRNLPFHVVFLCLMEEKDIYRNKKNIGVRQSPLVPHKDLAGVIASSVNVCGLSYRGWGQNGPEYGITTEGMEGQPTKRMAPLRPTEVSDFTAWVDMVRGFWNGPLPEPPIRSEELEAVLMESPEQPQPPKAKKEQPHGAHQSQQH